MTILLGIAAGAFFGVMLMGLLLCAKGNDACENCPYKNYYMEENNNGSEYKEFQSQ